MVHDQLIANDVAQCILENELPTQLPTELPTQLPTELPTQLPTELPTQLDGLVLSGCWLAWADQVKMKPFWEGAVLHQAINELHSAEKTIKQLLNGQRSHSDGPLASWPVTDITYEATYLADVHDRLKNEEGENEGIGDGQQEEEGEARKIKKQRRAQTVNPSHISNLLQYEIERQKEMIARNDARFQDFKTRLQFSRACYDHGLRNAAVVCDSGNMSAEATGILRESISETMHLFHTGKLPTQEVEGEGGEEEEVKKEEGKGKEEEEGEARKEGKRELMDGES